MDRRTAALAAAGLAAAALLPALLVRDAWTGTALILAGVGVLLLLVRVEWTLTLLVALTPLEDALAAQVHPQTTKAMGALLFAALVVRLLARRVVVPGHAAHRCLVLFLLLLLAASAAHSNGAAGLEVLLRYFSFAGVFLAAVVVFQDPVQLPRVLGAYVLGCGLAAALGLHFFISGAGSRASGPLRDPNDLAFVLVVAVPLAIVLQRRDGRRIWGALALLCVVGAAATISRGGLAALLALAVWAVVTGVVRPRVVAGSLVLVLASVLALVVAAPAQVSRALDQKSNVASSNIDTRVMRWRAAVQMTGDHPLLGLGPAGFRLNYDAYTDGYDPATVENGTVAHQMFLEVAAEAGFPALLAFSGFVGVALLSAGRVRRRGPTTHQRLLGAGVEAGLIATVTCSLFLTEQYYAPLWVLAGAAVALEQRLDQRLRPAAAREPARSGRAQGAPT